MAAPTPRKSKRVPISLAAWLSALSTSCRSILDTMSKEDSDATGPRLDVGAAVGTVAPPRGLDRVGLGCSWPALRSHRVGRGRRVLTLDAGSAILHCAVDAGGARQVARVAKGSGL